MSLLNDAELKRLEAKYPTGITSNDVVKIFQSKGELFSEATLRKYVQLGLLPTSKRIGIRGRHRGSSGIYPAVILRLINQIKKALKDGKTLGDIRTSAVVVEGELELVRNKIVKISRKIAASLQKIKTSGERQALRQEFLKHQETVSIGLKGLSQILLRLNDSKQDS